MRMVNSQGFADVGLFALCARVIAVYCLYIEHCHPISISRRSVVHTVQQIGVAEVDFMINILGKMTRTTPPSLTSRWRIACQCEWQRASGARCFSGCLLKRALRRAVSIFASPPIHSRVSLAGRVRHGLHSGPCNPKPSTIYRSEVDQIVASLGALRLVTPADFRFGAISGPQSLSIKVQRWAKRRSRGVASDVCNNSPIVKRDPQRQVSLLASQAVANKLEPIRRRAIRAIAIRQLLIRVSDSTDAPAPAATYRS